MALHYDANRPAIENRELEKFYRNLQKDGYGQSYWYHRWKWTFCALLVTWVGIVAYTAWRVLC